jgi:DNA-binding NarL/FixJ family response regulator
MVQHETVSVLIVDDHPVLRSGLRAIIETDPSLSVIGEAGDGEEGLVQIEEKKPDVTLLDIAMPRLTGLQVAKIVQERSLPAKLAILSMSADELIFNEVMDCGVLGYVLKENASNEILNCIRAVAGGNYYISPSVSGILVRRKQKQEFALHANPGLADLTPAEVRILKLVAGNKTSKEIGRDLSISYKTVENHRASIARKLSLNGNNALLRFALEHKHLVE